jgi:hypothetical protein
MLKIFERKAKCHLVRMLRNAYMNYTKLDASGPALCFFFANDFQTSWKAKDYQ